MDKKPMNKQQKQIESLRRRIALLERSYENTHDVDVRDRLIKMRREYVKLTGGTLSGSLYLDSHRTNVIGNNRNSSKNNGVTKF